MNSEKALLVVGSGGHSRFLLSLIANSNFEAHGILDLVDEFNGSELIMGVQVIGCLSSIRDFYNFGCRKIVLGVGDNYLRKKTFIQLMEDGFFFPNLVHPSAIIDPTATLGKGNVVGPNAVIGAEVVIGDNNIINSSAVIEHQSLIGDHNHISLSATVGGKVHIGDSVFLGANSTVIDKILISNETILGAGSVLVSSIGEAGLTLVGCPAKILRK